MGSIWRPRRPAHGLLGPADEVRFTADINFQGALEAEVRVLRGSVLDLSAEIAVLRAALRTMHRTVRMVHRVLSPWPDARDVLRAFIPLAATPDPEEKV